MNEKYSLQYIIESVAEATGESKKVADQFSKAFFDTIVEALYLGETSIKIKGLGTFKLIDVESRESVNVANGERITIPAYKKVTFVPDEEIAEKLTARHIESIDVEEPKDEEDDVPEHEEAVESVEVAESNENVEIVEEPEPVEDAGDIEALVAPEESELVEQPANALSGIDLLIATPESIEEIKAQYAEAKRKADEAIAAAKQANTERARLEKMLERLDKNEYPEEAVVEQPVEAEPVAESVIPEPEPEAIVEESPAPVQVEDAESSEDSESEPLPVRKRRHSKVYQYDQRISKNKKWAGIIVLLLIIVGGVLLVLRRMNYKGNVVVDASVVGNTMRNKVSPSSTKTPVAEVTPAVGTDTLNRNDSVAAANAVKEDITPPAEPQRTIPDHCVLKKGESLTILSVRYYGTKDSVPAIIRFNRFKDPNKIPVGARIYLP